jgi:two-component system, cell cycle response regulator DivK
MSSVLVIEDNEDNFELIRIILGANGYQVIHAATGFAGIEGAFNLKPAFILLDIQLPDMDGEAVLRHIRSQEAGKQIPIIAVTSFAMSGDRERLLSAGCNGYIEKPIDSFKIIEQIETIING